MSVAHRTIKAGELTAADLEAQGQRQAQTERHEAIPVVPSWSTLVAEVATGVTKEVMTQVMTQAKKGGSGGGNAGLWVALVILACAVGGQWAAFGIHVAGDGTLREQIVAVKQQAKATDERIEAVKGQLETTKAQIAAVKGQLEVVEKQLDGVAELVEYLVRKDMARERGDPPPPIPFRVR